MRHITKSIKSAVLFVITALFTATLMSSNLYAQTPSADGTVTSVSGYVTVTDNNGKVLRLQEGDKVKEGNIINTGKDSSLTLLLQNRQIITLGALETLTLTPKISANSGYISSTGGSSGSDSSSSSTGSNLSKGSSSLSAAVSAGGSPVQ